jgi:phosphatidylglycerol lysyltransferase
VVGAQVGIAALDWVLAGAARAALLPAGQRPGFLTFLGVFLIAQFAGLVSHVPGGLGVVESILVLLLARDIPPTTLLGALVAYRAVYYLLPFGIAVVMLGMHELRPYLPRVLSAARVVVGWVPRLIPRVLSGAVFLSGATLLLSGAAPGDQGRLSWLNGILPLDVIQVSHFVGSLAGVGLVVLAWALWQRLDAAYGLTVVLLAAGLGVSVMRGGDWDEAAALSLVFGTVLPLRRTFYRRSALAGEPLEAGWLLSILVVAAASIWLGLFVPSQVLDGHQSWWRFAFSGNDPWLLRASVGLVAVALVVGVMRLVRHAPANVKPPSRAELDRAAALLTAWPDASANLALLGDKALLFSKSGRGVLMFGVEGRSWVALGDPVGDAADQMELAWRFSELADRHGGWPVFYQIGAHRLPLYIDLGLKLLKVGEEARVPLKDFSLEGPSRRGLRQNQRRIEREGVSFEVLPPGQVCSVLPELRLVSDTWLREKRTREKGCGGGPRTTSSSGWEWHRSPVFNPERSLRSGPGWAGSCIATASTSTTSRASGSTRRSSTPSGSLATWHHEVAWPSHSSWPTSPPSSVAG